MFKGIKRPFAEVSGRLEQFTDKKARSGICCRLRTSFYLFNDFGLNIKSILTLALPKGKTDILTIPKHKKQKKRKRRKR